MQISSDRNVFYSTFVIPILRRDTPASNYKKSNQLNLYTAENIVFENFLKVGDFKKKQPGKMLEFTRKCPR